MNPAANSEQPQPKTPLESLWTFGATITSLLAGFLQPPPAPSYGAEDANVTRVAQFAITIMAGLLVAAGARFRRRKDWWWWALISIAALATAIALNIYYTHMTDRYTALYNDGRVVVGADDAYLDPVEDPPRLNKTELILDHGGNVYEIWERKSIDDRRMELTVIFLLTLPFFTISIVTAVQTWQCLRIRSADEGSKTTS